jgi:transcriptional regulator with XRE-family HTH domain
MRVACKLRTHRGDRSLAVIEAATYAAGHNVSGGILSQIERGRTLPTDEQIPVLEQVYGIAFADWYESPYVLIALQPDEDAA